MFSMLLIDYDLSIKPHRENTMRHSTLRQLEVFATIARLGSFSRAADELFLTNAITGIQPITQYRKKQYAKKVSSELIEKLNEYAGLSPSSSQDSRGH